MPKFATIRASRFFAVLCMALAIVYAGALTSQIVDQVQHAPAQVSYHDHMIFSDAGGMSSVGDHHADDHDDVHPNEPDAPGHHHHSDTGPGLMLAAAFVATPQVFFESMRAPLNDHDVTHIAVPGPERPPKLARLTA